MYLEGGGGSRQTSETLDLCLSGPYSLQLTPPWMIDLADLLERLTAALGERYRIVREVGSGGAATVYLAEDLKHHRQVAVKVLRPELAAALGSDRFIREIEVAARLTHPHVLPLHDSGEADGFLYYVMPYIEGESLRQKIEREGELPVAEAVRLLREVVDALAKSHAEGVVHRDIKPDNVLLSGRHALVTDFGVAKAVSEATGRHDITTAGIALGTPTYMAPEQAAAERHIDHRADIYAVGVLAYEMLTGQPPFTGATSQAILAAHVTEAPDPVTKRRPAVAAELNDFVMKCLEKKPADRWQTAEEMLPRLEAMTTPSGGVTPAGSAPVKRGGTIMWRWGATAAAIVVVAVSAVVVLSRNDAEQIPANRRSVAVLPFANTSGEAENEAFTNGIHDEILTQLSRITDLKVIARTSVLEYEGTEKSLREIGEELGVGTLLEGGVQRAGESVRINVSLVDAATGELIWSHGYDAQLSVENIFAIQAEIAEQIAAALDATLTPAVQARIAATPTEDLEAYEAYLRGTDYFRRGYEEPDLRIAAQLFERATGLDPEFALAWAKLSEVHGQLWWFHYDRSNERILAAERGAFEALRLAPDDPSTHIALGRYYYRRLDFERALEEFQITRSLGPASSELLAAMAYVQRRQGLIEEAADNLKQAAELDPRYAVLVSETGDTYARLRDEEQAKHYYDRAIALSPDFREPHYGKARRLQLRLQGDAAMARQTIEAARGFGARDPNFDFILVQAAMIEGQYQDALGLLSRQEIDAFETQHFYVPIPLAVAQVHGLLGGESGAQRSFESARRVLEHLVAESPDDPRLYSSLGLAYAGLGMSTEAVRTGEQAIDLMPMSSDFFRGFYRLEDLAHIYAMVGEHDKALDQIEYLLSVHGDLTGRYLAADPTWGSLREHPRFRALVR